MVNSCKEQPRFDIDQVYYGFKLIEKRFVKEVNAECLYFEHEKSGARLMKIAADDPNKLFNIAFKTLPENDFGTPHILEHAVLNGSGNFPVKSPFDILMKGSLNTFLNAMTSSDYTTYPVASMNMTDYFNLMYVYLDAVFNPLMLTDSRILKQEGWHYELPEKDAQLTYKGVVYNEMKGAYSDPMTELYYQIGKNLFPDNTYGCESGGHPNYIPKLTQEYFTAFHRKFYHPSNSYILLYGNADLNRELAFINENYLSKYQKSGETAEISFQKPLQEMKVAESPYAVPEGSPVKDNTYLSLSFVTNENTDRTTTMAFNLIANALVNHESAPVRLALQDAGIGREVMGWFSESKQNLFTILVQNANPEERDKFREVVFSTLKKVVAEGFDATAIEGILNRTEFNLKEGDYSQKGLLYLFRNQQPWIYSGNAFLGLEFDKSLSEIKQSVKTRLLESLVDKYLVKNPHSLLLTLKPEPGLQSEKESELSEELAAFKASLSETQVDSLVKETQSLVKFQQSEDTPEAIASIPMLKLSDIPAEAEYYQVEDKEAAGIPVMFCNQFTNGIIYSNWYFDLRTLPQGQIPYASLLTSLLGKLGTERYSFGDLDNQLNIQTGGFYAELNTFLVDRNDEEMMPKLIVSAKATAEKTGKMADLIPEILLHSNYADKSRLKSVLIRLQSNMDADIKQNGLNYARIRASSYSTNSGVFSELINGLDYYRFLTDITTNFDQKSSEIVKNLEETAALLFNRKNLIASVTCSPDELSRFMNEIGRTASVWRENPVAFSPWKFDYHDKNEAMLSASKVQYVVKGYNFRKLGYAWNGKISVLNQIISTDWLQNQVRVIGGAYGGFSSFSPYGAAYFMSYRDPNLKETLQIYDSTTVFLEKFNADETAITRFIIGTIARLDQPKTASQKGRTAMQCFFEKTTSGMLRKERKEILSTTAEDIRGMKKMVGDILAQNTWCVYGNEAKVRENSHLFKELINIDEQTEGK
jgi:Zn-dependent M16 (insulinase) family peptidase